MCKSAAKERLSLVLLALLAFSPYFWINHLTASWPARDFSTAIDHAIPFQPVWELVYVSVYFYMFLPVLYVRERLIFRRAVLAFCVIQFVGFAFFLLLPVGMERPELLDIDEHFLHWGLALNWSIDQPRNLFPSLHLANAVMVSLLMLRLDRLLGMAALIWAALIGYSTLAAKHHLFGDVIAGTVLALVVDRFLLAPVIPSVLPANALYPRQRVIFLPLIYALIVLALFALWRLGWQPFEWPH